MNSRVIYLIITLCIIMILLVGFERLQYYINKKDSELYKMVYGPEQQDVTESPMEPIK